jgi:hypothetical protein
MFASAVPVCTAAVRRQRPCGWQPHPPQVLQNVENTLENLAHVFVQKGQSSERTVQHLCTHKSFKTGYVDGQKCVGSAYFQNLRHSPRRMEKTKKPQCLGRDLNPVLPK